MFLKGIKKKIGGRAENAVTYPQITLYVDLLFCLVILPLTIMLVPIDKWFVSQPRLLQWQWIIYLYFALFCVPQSEHPVTVHAKKVWTDYHDSHHAPVYNRTDDPFPCRRIHTPNCRWISAATYIPKASGSFSSSYPVLGWQQNSPLNFSARCSPVRKWKRRRTAQNWPCTKRR